MNPPRLIMFVACWVIAFSNVSLRSVTLAADRQSIVENLGSPESVVTLDDGKTYVTVQGRVNAPGDGEVVVLENGTPRTIAKGLDDPKGIDRRGKELFVADRTKVWCIVAAGEAKVYIDADKFPDPPRLLNDVSVGPNGDVFVSDLMGGAVYRITPAKEVVAVVDAKSTPTIRPNGLLADGPDHLLVLEFTAGKLYRLNLADRSLTEIAKGLGSPDGIARDAKGRLYISDNRGGRVFRIDKPGDEPKVLAEGFRSTADISIDPKGRLLVPETSAGKVTAIEITD